MYTFDDLKKYEYFKNINMSYALDSLTGVLSRSNILGFAKYLVDNKIPFMMGILDIDNFKLVNDNYGHKVGDECLKSIAANLAKYIGEDGLVGRFGGDEFVVIFFKYTSYDEVHDYIEVKQRVEIASLFMLNQSIKILKFIERKKLPYLIYSQE